MSAIKICLQIGDKGTILFDTPSYNEKLRINLPEWSKGLPLKAEAVDLNDPFYQNGDNLKNSMWPCRLKDSNVPAFNRTTHIVNKLKKTKLYIKRMTTSIQIIRPGKIEIKTNNSTSST